MSSTKPIVVQYGERIMGEYPIDEYKNSLKRAFGVSQADYIVLDSSLRGQRFLCACVAWAIESGILWHDLSVDDSQCTLFSFRLTESERQFLDEL